MFILPHPLVKKNHKRNALYFKRDVSMLQKAEAVNLVESSVIEVEEHLTLEHQRRFLFLFLWADKSLLVASGKIYKGLYWYIC